MKLYNTRSRQLETVKPIDGHTLRIYSCGPTVYDHAHIGNLSAYIFADTLRRAAVGAGFRVKHVMNYTDVDDKTIRRSKTDKSSADPHQALRQLTDRYIKLFNDDMVKIGNDVSALTFVRATESIQAMTRLIGQLHQAGFAYVSDDGVYFSIEAYRRSGKIYGQLLELTASNTSESRIQNDEYDKESIHDFALWKKQKTGEPAWPLELDGQDLTGRPGWHIECSVMSQQQLGLPFDIHTGGIDLIFPHHENEIAQSTALGDNSVMAQIFAHNNHVLVEGSKMAKSAGNFLTLNDVINKGFDPLAFRVMILQTHYSHEAQFSWENLTAAANRLNNWRSVADLRWQTNDMAKKLDLKLLEQHQPSTALADNLDTPKAIFGIDQVLSAAQNGLQTSDQSAFADFLRQIDSCLGLDLADRPDITQEQKRLLEERQKARDSKDWTRSDQLRQDLQSQGIAVRDLPNGQLWSRTVDGNKLV